MSELEAFSAHCRAMADPNPPLNGRPSGWCQSFGKSMPIDHARCTTTWCACRCHPRNASPTEPERRLWAALADEVDRYLAGGDADDDEPLFGEDA